MYISLWYDFWGHPENVIDLFNFLKISIDGSRQNDSQGFLNSCNSIDKTH